MYELWDIFWTWKMVPEKNRIGSIKERLKKLKKK